MVNVKDYTRKEVIRRCPYCHHDMTMKKGLSSENIKRLFRKPTMEDFITLFILFLTITSFLIYTYEIKAHKDYINVYCPIGQHNQQNTEIYLPSPNISEGNSNDTISFYELNSTNQTDEKR